MCKKTAIVVKLEPFGLTVPERLTETRPMKRGTAHGNSATGMKLRGIGRRSVAVLVAVIGLCVAAGAARASEYQDTLPDGQINRGSARVFTVLTYGGESVGGRSVVPADVGDDDNEDALCGAGGVLDDFNYSSGVVIDADGVFVLRRPYYDMGQIDSSLMNNKIILHAA